MLDDGSETDLDLGHYERFLDVNLKEYSSVSAGKIYEYILNGEREGIYLGKNVQLIPHVTSYIKESFVRGTPQDERLHVRIIEIGGSTGDFEGEVFLESFRQFQQENKDDVLHFHLGFVPFLKCSGEYKTKPMQLSTRELLRHGLQPDLIGARYSKEGELDLTTEILDKIALFCNVPKNRVISLPDVSSIYAVPKNMVSSNLKLVLSEFLQMRLDAKLPDFYLHFVGQEDNWPEVKIGIVAKYSRLSDAYLSILESLKIAGIDLKSKVHPIFIDAEKIEHDDPEELSLLHSVQGIIVPGGFGRRGMEGKIVAAKYARENRIPYLGICLGLQMAVVEFAKNVCGLNAVSSEMYETRDELFDKDVVIDYMEGQKHVHKKGGTMRLGGYDCELVEGTMAKDLFGLTNIRERHRHRLEVIQDFLNHYEQNGLIVSGKHHFKNNNGESAFLIELIELKRELHPYFIATQSHPEFLSRPGKPHSLFSGLVDAAGKVNL